VYLNAFFLVNVYNGFRSYPLLETVGICVPIRSVKSFSFAVDSSSRSNICPVSASNTVCKDTGLLLEDNKLHSINFKNIFMVLVAFYYFILFMIIIVVSLLLLLQL
jgi:hypothetical protein